VIALALREPFFGPKTLTTSESLQHTAMIALDGFPGIQPLGDTGFRLGINRKKKESKEKKGIPGRQLN
jgi:hypothetical protein